MPAAYVIADTRVKDIAVLEEYRKLAHPSVLTFKGQYLAAGGMLETLIGDWHPQRLSVVRFDSMQIARDWWSSAEYSKARALRTRQMGESRILIVEGL